MHFGGLNNGHYEAICKNNNDWILYDDKTFKKIKEPFNKNAYILFYKRKNLDKLYEEENNE